MMGKVEITFLNGPKMTREELTEKLSTFLRMEFCQRFDSDLIVDVLYLEETPRPFVEENNAAT